MEDSLTNFDISSSTVQVNMDSNSNSDHSSDNFEEILNPDLGSSNNEGLENVSKSDSGDTEEDFDKNLPETISLLTHPIVNVKVYLVGTVHFSVKSQQEVIKVIQKVKPHIVLLEICESRASWLTLDEKTMFEESQKLNMDTIISLIKKNGVYCGLTYLLVQNMNKHITKEVGMAPGGEFRVAYQEAMKIPNCRVLLGDRPVTITLLRALSKLTWFQTFKLAYSLLFNKETITKEDLENCKKRDILEEFLAQLAGEYPALGEVFVTERDMFLTHSIQEAAFNHKFYMETLHKEPTEPLRVVAVVGMGHIIGIQKLWPQRQAPFIKETLIIPPPSLSTRIIRLTVKLSFYSLIAYTIYRFVPVPKTIKRGCQMGLQHILVGSQAALHYVVSNARTQYNSFLRK